MQKLEVPCRRRGVAFAVIAIEPLDAAQQRAFRIADNRLENSTLDDRLLADSIHTFGFTNPVLIDGQNMILAGHGRVEAATLLTMANVPRVRIETTTPAAADDIASVPQN